MKYINKFIIIAFLIILMLPYSSVLAAPLPKHQPPQKQTTKPSNQRTVNTANSYDLSVSSNYNIRIDGANAGDSLSYGGIFTQDLNNNGKEDLIISAWNESNNSRSQSGSVYIIYDNIISSLTGTGNNIDLANSSNYNLRFDGAAAGDLTYEGFATDIDNDNKPDLFISVSYANNNSREDSGSFYIIKNALLSTYSGTGNNIDLANPSNYNIRYDGAKEYGYFSYSAFTTSDVNGDGKQDLLVGAADTNNSRDFSGSNYIIYNNLINSYSGTGNNVDLLNSSNYNIRFDGASAGDSLSWGDNYAKDMDLDGKEDLIMTSAFASNNTRTANGSIYIINNNIFGNKTGVGNIVDLANTSNYSIRFDGAVDNDVIGISDVNKMVSSEDLNNNGKPDFIIPVRSADNNSLSNSGSLYVIFDSVFGSLTGTGNNIDLAQTSNYNIRYDGASAVDKFSGNSIKLQDINNDGKIDIVASSSYADPYKGIAYVIKNDLINSNNGTGNNLSLGNTANYSYSYKGATLESSLGAGALNLSNLTSSTNNDLLIGASDQGSNSRANSGSVYIIYNYPHTITTNTISSSNISTSLNLTGSITAPNSVTNISTVEYKLDDGSFTSCTATDGLFNSKSEDYSCALSSLTVGSHTISIRSQDTKGSYTPSSKYKSTTFNVLPIPTESKAVVDANNVTITTRKPVISGVNANAKTIEVQSTLQTYTVTPDGSGNWSITVTNALEDGSHIVTVKNNSGTVLSTTTFNVQSNEPSAFLADTGQYIQLQFILGIGILFVVIMLKKIKIKEYIKIRR